MIFLIRQDLVELVSKSCNLGGLRPATGEFSRAERSVLILKTSWDTTPVRCGQESINKLDLSICFRSGVLFSENDAAI